MKRVLCFLSTALAVSICLASELPEVSVSDKVISPPKFRSYKLTKTIKRGPTEILRDILNGPSSEKTLRMQHVIWEGNVVFSVRETCNGTIVSSSHGKKVPQEIDVNRDGKRDLLLLLAAGGQEVAEAFLFGKDGFLSPLPSQSLFNEKGIRLHHEAVVKKVQKEMRQR